MRPALSDYQHLASGKVRELYGIDDEHMLFVATDRISAYDYILDSEIPDKGRILTAMSVFFFDYVEAPNHLAGHLTTSASRKRCSAGRWSCRSSRCCRWRPWPAAT